MSDGLRRESRRIDDIGVWLTHRREHVTASRVGALWDQHPYLSREQLAAELRGISTKGDTSAMRRGRIFEAAVIEALKEAHPDWRIERAHDYHWLPDHRIGATPDAYLDDDGLIECKTVHPRKWEEWHGAPPIGYLLQLLTGLMCTGRQHGVLACMVMGGSYEVYEFTVERHPEAETRIIDATAQWWAEYDAGRIAAPQSAAEIEAMLDNGSHKDLSENREFRELLEARRDLKADISRLTQRLGETEYAIKNTLGPASTAWLPGYSIQFRRSLRRAYTVEEAFVRTLRVKEITVE